MELDRPAATEAASHRLGELHGARAVVEAGSGQVRTALAAYRGQEHGEDGLVTVPGRELVDLRWLRRGLPDQSRGSLGARDRSPGLTIHSPTGA